VAGRVDGAFAQVADEVVDEVVDVSRTTLTSATHIGSLEIKI